MLLEVTLSVISLVVAAILGFPSVLDLQEAQGHARHFGHVLRFNLQLHSSHLHRDSRQSTKSPQRQRSQWIMTSSVVILTPFLDAQIQVQVLVNQDQRIIGPFPLRG